MPDEDKKEALIAQIIPNPNEDAVNAPEDEGGEAEEEIVYNHGGRPLKFETPEKLEEKAEEYFKSCWTQKYNMFGQMIYEKDFDDKKQEDKPVMIQTKPYTITGLAVFLDTSRETLLDYEHSNHKDVDSETAKRFSDAIKKLKERCHAYSEEQLFLAKNATGPIFNLKNNYGWKDEQKFDLTSKGKSIAPKIISDV